MTLFSASHVARLAECSADTVRRDADRGLLRVAERSTAGVRLFQADAVEAYVAQRRARAEQRGGAAPVEAADS